MPLKSPLRGLTGAIGGHLSPQTRRTAIIVGVGILASFLVKSVPNAGSLPLLVLAGSVLVAVLDGRRSDRRLLMAVSLSAMVALAASDTPMTSGLTEQATSYGNEASIFGPAKLVELIGVAGTFLYERGLPWVMTEAIPGLARFIQGLASGIGS